MLFGEQIDYIQASRCQLQSHLVCQRWRDMWQVCIYSDNIQSRYFGS